MIRLQPTSDPEVELFPFYVKLYRHQTQQQQQQQARQTQMTSITGMMGGIGGMVVGNTFAPSASAQQQPQTPKRYWAFSACFSRKHTVTQVYDFIASRLRINKDDIRIYNMKEDKSDVSKHSALCLHNVTCSVLV